MLNFILKIDILILKYNNISIFTFILFKISIFKERGVLMNYVQMSEEAYEEFKSFLEASNVQNYNLRISYLGRNCSGLTFNLDNDVSTKDDICQQVHDINFIADKDLINEYGGFKILSNAENGGNGLELKAIIIPKCDCSVCNI